MSGTAFCATARLYGVKLVCRTLEQPRSSYYADRQVSGLPVKLTQLGKRGPKTALSDVELLELIRVAKGLSERPDKDTARFGGVAQRELQRLCHVAHAPPNRGEWQAFYARFIHLITRNLDHENDRGKFARRLLKELKCMWVFLYEQGVTPTNNHAERVLRFAVLWRKRSLGTKSDKGDRWVDGYCLCPKPAACGAVRPFRS